MMIYDLDHFKQINNKLGHPEGDKVLKLVGDFLSSEFRREDIVAKKSGKNRFYIDEDRKHCKQKGCIECAIDNKKGDIS